jgi:flagellar capping protein FliD
VLTLTEPQVWVLIGVFAAAVVGVMGTATTSVNRTLSASLASVDTRIDGLREVMEAKFDKMDAKFDLLDRDIQALSRRVFGTDPS